MIMLAANLAIFCYMYCGCLRTCLRLWACPVVTFDVVDDLYVVVCGCGPHDKLNLAIFCCMYCVPVGEGVIGCLRVSESVGVSCGCLGLPLMF